MSRRVSCCLAILASYRPIYGLSIGHSITITLIKRKRRLYFHGITNCLGLLAAELSTPARVAKLFSQCSRYTSNSTLTADHRRLRSHDHVHSLIQLMAPMTVVRLVTIDLQLVVPGCHGSIPLGLGYSLKLVHFHFNVFAILLRRRRRR